MAQKKTTPRSAAHVAAVDMVIAGQHVSAGDPIDGASEDEQRVLIASRRAVTREEFEGHGAPAPEAEDAGKPEGLTAKPGAA